ncbi:MAG: hypothetical protein JW888_00050 [Pirellulales bacterium]|nr:hypothetical protein [Pirellulales bacterium]
MSEYQYVAFRAIDRAVSKKDLAYMRRQSTRAEITPWSFENEYDFGDFHGNALEMMRRGYDLHLHYANFGVRTLLVRLPDGFPNAKAAKPYFADGALGFHKDKKGPGGTLMISPSLEPDTLDELWDINEMLDRLVPLRSEILAGDLRPLYLAHLAVVGDDDHDPDEAVEAPVPAGLKKPTDAQCALAEFVGVSKAMLAAAAERSGPLPAIADKRSRYSQWLSDQPEATKDAWLAELLSDSESSVQAKIRAKFEKAAGVPSWPAVEAGRTVAQLKTTAEEIHCKKKKAAEAKATRQRTTRLTKMAADPTPYLRTTEKLVAERTTAAYEEACKLLADYAKPSPAANSPT